MSYTNGLDNPELYFQTKLYAGNGSSQSITFDGSENMQPDWVWIKSRTDTRKHNLYDVVRGTNKRLVSNATSAEDEPDNNAGVNSFNSDGFTVGSETDVNGSSRNFASWNWKAGGSASSNTDGSITSTVSANTTSGFSIVSYTGNGSAGATVGHGLSQEPNVIIFKNRNDGSTAWCVYHSAKGTSGTGRLNTNNAFSDTAFITTTPSSSVFTLTATAIVNASSNNIIAYCFAEKKGFSKFGSYSGNGNADGPFIFTGFKPSFYLWKRTDVTSNWFIVDNKRDAFNETDAGLFPDSSAAESIGNGYNGVDFLSNGVKVRQGNSDINNSSGTYIYMAFAEAPLVGSNGVTAKAR